MKVQQDAVLLMRALMPMCLRITGNSAIALQATPKPQPTTMPVDGFLFVESGAWMRHSFGIARKIHLSIAALIIGLGLIGFAYWRVSMGVVTSDQRLQQFKANDDRLQVLAQTFAQARRAQAEYALSFSVASAQVFNDERQQLQQQATQQPALQAELDEYLHSANALDQRISELGHDPDSGLQGQLRTAVHGIEKLLENYPQPQLQISMLSMRRHEKDFMLRREQQYADAFGEQAMPFALHLQQARMPEQSKRQISELMQQYQQAFLAYAAARFGVDSEVQALDAVASQLAGRLQALRQQQNSVLKQQREALEEERARMDLVFAGTLLTVTVLLLSMLWLLLRAIVRPLDEAVAFAHEIAADRLYGQLQVRNHNDEIGRLGHALLQMQSSLRQRTEAERASAAGNLRVRQALDAALASVMVADADGVVLYVNAALRRSFAAAGLPEAALIGEKVASLTPLLQPLLDNTTASGLAQHSEIELGASRFALQLSPIVDAGQLLGTAIDWRDLHMERVIEHEVASLVSRAARGHLQQRLNVDDKTGLLRQLAESINRLLHSVQQRLDQTTQVMAYFAAGDLCQRIESDGEGVYARLQQSMDTAMRQVGEMVADIQGSVASVHTAADEMAAGTADLSARSERQACDLQQAMALVGGVAQAAQHNLEHAHSSARVALDASAAAAQGREVANAAIGGMQAIRRSTQRIAEIVTTVDGLTFQTNLLALNAAVEAARAGPQGKGFAVVASEVRNLAQRSAEAAQEIKALLAQSLQEVDAGARHVDGTGTTMAEILHRVQRMAEVMDAVREASGQQNAAVAELKTVLQRIGHNTEHNAALAEQTSAAAASLREQAMVLTMAADTFVVADSRTEQSAAVPTLRHAEPEYAGG
jgi:methyl-accepting chemotaxis protein